MNPWLIVILILIANLVIYYIFFGKKKFEDKWQAAQDGNLPGPFGKL